MCEIGAFVRGRVRFCRCRKISLVMMIGWLRDEFASVWGIVWYWFEGEILS